MKYRYLVLFGVLAAVVAVALVPIVAQTPRAASSTAAQTKSYTPPRTAWGDPDLQGIWRGLHREPFERPPQYAGRQFLTDAEVAELEQKGEASNAERLAGKQENRGFRSQPNYNSIVGYTADKVRYSHRTSAIIDPPDGHLPPWTLEQVNRYEAREAVSLGRGEADWVVDRPASERCIAVVDIATLGYFGMSLGGESRVLAAARGSEAFQRPEALNGGEAYSNTGALSNTAFGGPVIRFLQTPGYVAITMDEVEDYRIVPLDGRPHLASKIRQWKGDVRGQWDGNTLVVETTNIKFPYPIIPSYDGNGLYPGDGETLRVTERFTRLDRDTIEYRYTIDDPGVYTRPYTVLHELTRDDAYKVSAPICHEGHDDMPAALASGRVDEETALENVNDSRKVREPRFEQLKEQALKVAEQKKGR